MPLIDRERTCPVLVRTFVSKKHSLETEYRGLAGVPRALELSLYTWGDATLGELAELIRERVQDARAKRDTPGGRRKPTLHFTIVYPDRQGCYVMKSVGTVVDKPRDGERDAADVTLGGCGWQAGDYVDVAWGMGE